MKLNSIIFLFAALLTCACSSNQGLELVAVNPLDQQREDAIILLTAEEISGWMEIPDGKVPILTYKDGKPLPCQLDDLDNDGKWDELFTLIPMKSNESLSIRLKFIVPEKFPVFKSRTNLRLGANKPGYPELLSAERLEGITYSNHGRTGQVYQMEGPAWENDKVGFRNYLDQRNGMDIFGKLTGDMVLDSVGIAGGPSYHEPDNWGMDILIVNKSLGAGSIAYMYDDSLYRVGDNGTGSYHVLFEGSQRSRFELTYSNWKVDGTPVAVSHQIEIAGGRHCYQSFVTFSGTDHQLDLVPGIVNISSDTAYLMKLNDHFTCLMTHDYQSADSSLLAMAIVVPTQYLKETGKTRDTGEGVTQTYYMVLKAEANQPTPYRFYALWEKEDPRWSSIAEVSEYLKQEADRWAYSVIVQPAP